MTTETTDIEITSDIKTAHASKNSDDNFCSKEAFHETLQTNAQQADYRFNLLDENELEYCFITSNN